MIQFDELYYIQKFSIFDKLRIKINKRPKQRSMQYRQDSRLKTNQTKRTASQGLKIQQIIYDKEIVQQWKVKTDNPKQILAYSLRHLYLQRLCDAWHQIKFLYFQNYHEVIHKNHSGKIIHQSYEESDIQVVYSSERIQQCKTFIKKIWKLTRQRILNAMNKIKIQAGFDQDQSLQVEEDLNQYMRFLKLQQNKRIDIAIENLDSVVEKNTRRKLLNAFLNMREKMKRAKRSQFYRDKIRLECFVEICLRNLRKLNSQLIFDSFISIFEYSEGIRVHREQIRKRKLQEERLIKQQKQRQDHYRSISNRKEIQIHEEDNENQDTVEKKQKRTNKTQTQQIIKGNNFSTVKRQHQSDRVNIINVLQDNHEEEHQESNHVVHSNYYYDELQQQDYHGNSYQNQNLTNMNNLKTKRSHHSKYNHQENQYQGNDLQTNINSAILNKKTARTPSRSDIKHNTFNSAQIHEFSSKNYNSTHSRNYQEQLHIPITQRIQKHHESHYEEETHEQKSSSSQQQKVYQQICVIRNFVQTPKREPDRFEKIPVLSNNIEFKQFFLNSKSKSAQRQNIHTHTSSFYERKQCENCYFCTKLKNIKSIVEQFQRKKHVQTTSKTEINQKVIVTQHLQSTQTQQPNYQANKVVNTSQNRNLSSNQQFNQVKIVSNSNHVQNHSQNNHHSVQIPLTNIIKDATNLQVPVSKQNTEKFKTQLKSTELMRSPHFIGKTSPKPQIIQQSSAILERSRNKSQHQSQRKIFARKPMH